MSTTINNEMEIVIDVWGDFACFTRPESKIERVSYPCINPSAARGVLNAIYSKPIEFYYQINKIEIMNPIKTINIKKNEFKEKTNNKLDPVYNINEKGAKGLTQRNNVYLKDVYYRIYATIIKQPNFLGSTKQLYEQFIRRVKKGKCFYNPSLGNRECFCYFSLPNYEKQPLNFNLDIGIMTYDIFDIRNNIPLDTRIESKNNNEIYNPSFFYAKIENGVLEVPKYESEKVFKIKGGNYV